MASTGRRCSSPGGHTLLSLVLSTHRRATARRAAGAAPEVAESGDSEPGALRRNNGDFRGVLWPVSHRNLRRVEDQHPRPCLDRPPVPGRAPQRPPSGLVVHQLPHSSLQSTGSAAHANHEHPASIGPRQPPLRRRAAAGGNHLPHLSLAGRRHRRGTRRHSGAAPDRVRPRPPVRTDLHAVSPGGREARGRLGVHLQHRCGVGGCCSRKDLSGMSHAAD